MLPSNLEEENGGGGGGIERVHTASRGDSREQIAPLTHQHCQSPVLSSDDYAHWNTQIDLVEGAYRAWIGPERPDTLIFQPSQKRRQTRNPRYSQVF
jgi:hypothetical protein